MSRLLLLLLVVAVACDGGNRVPAPVLPPSELRIESPRTSGAGDRLAAELLRLTGAVPPAPFHTTADELPAGSLRDRLRRIAFDHLRTVAFGAGHGPELIGSRRIARLALLPDAPRDGNGNGSNRDEVLAAERRRVSATAGAAPLPDSWQALFPWHEASADLAQPPTSSATPASWRAVGEANAATALADIGGAMLARARAAGFLLQRSRGSLAGSSTDDGRLGLDLLHQALAAEETLLGSLFTNGGSPGALADPERYDPEVDLRWLPARVIVRPEPTVPGSIGGYRVDDVASDLFSLAQVLQAAGELAWLSAADNPYPALRDVFRGHPFGTPGGPRPPGGLSAQLPALSWRGEIGPLILFRCQGCHLGFGSGGFIIDTLADVLAGSPQTRAANLTMVVPGDHSRSFLWQILDGPPAPFNRMPLGSRLGQGEIDLVARWIDEGAREEPTVIPPPPLPGKVLAQVLFANLVFLHLDPATGDLRHRVENGASSGYATAQATGAALQALAVVRRAVPTLSYDGRTVGDVLLTIARRAMASLLAADGTVAREVELVTGRTRIGELGDQAMLAAGLMAAGDVLGDEAVSTAGRAAAERLIDAFWRADSGWFVTSPDGPSARYEGRDLSALLAVLPTLAATDPEVAALRDRFLSGWARVAAFAEWDGGGEVLGDGIADTDGNGVPEPAAAGGAFGRLPVLASAWLAGDSGALVADDVVTWSRHVLPLFQQKCGECHLAGAAQGEYRLDTVALAATPGSSGGALPLLVPGDPEGSFLYRKLVDRQPAIGVQMPEARSPLDARGRELVRAWILQGALRQ
ncbi:MAG: hypothetical protein IPK26_01605 [Planctomycetes bacterium]|nr:hypothetical protein [Planctomycetota bacterium]